MCGNFCYKCVFYILPILSVAVNRRHSSCPVPLSGFYIICSYCRIGLGNDEFKQLIDHIKYFDGFGFLFCWYLRC